MRDHDGGELKFVDQLSQQVQQAGLHRHIEPGGRLIHEDQARAGHQIACDLQALLHTTRVGARQVIHALDIQLHAGHPVQRPAAQLPVVTLSEGHQPLADIGTARHVHA